MKTIVIDPGHGGQDPGAVYKGNVEKEFNLALSLKVRDILFKRYEAKVMMTRTADQTVSLSERTRFANRNNADLFCSIHHNAGGGTGFESYIFNGNVPPKTIQAQDTIHDVVANRLTAKYNVTNRGIKRANFYVLRETEMSAVLLEMLFIDHPRDLQLLHYEPFVNDAAEAVAEGIAKALSLPVETRTNKKPLYQVIAGSFKEKENANNRVAFLEQQQIDTFIVKTELSGETYYRVQAGAFRNRINAEERVRELRRMGVGEPFIVTVFTQDPDSSPEQSIMGKTVLTPNEMDQFVKKVNPDAPEVGKYYAEFGQHYNVKGDIAFAQAIHETNYFRFTGVVDPEQNNYAGLGATGPEQNGASFSTPREGVLAHIQHLYAYASTKPLPEGYPLVDPRFNLVNRGSATSWIALNGKWAVPGDGYGDAILTIYNKMADTQGADPIPPENILKKLLKKIGNLVNKAKKVLK